MAKRKLSDVFAPIRATVSAGVKRVMGGLSKGRSAKKPASKKPTTSGRKRRRPVNPPQQRRRPGRRVGPPKRPRAPQPPKKKKKKQVAPPTHIPAVPSPGLGVAEDASLEEKMSKLRELLLDRKAAGTMPSMGAPGNERPPNRYPPLEHGMVTAPTLADQLAKQAGQLRTPKPAPVAPMPGNSFADALRQQRRHLTPPTEEFIPLPQVDTEPDFFDQLARLRQKIAPEEDMDDDDTDSDF